MNESRLQQLASKLEDCLRADPENPIADNPLFRAGLRLAIEENVAPRKLDWTPRAFIERLTPDERRTALRLSGKQTERALFALFLIDRTHVRAVARDRPLLWRTGGVTADTREALKESAFTAFVYLAWSSFWRDPLMTGTAMAVWTVVVIAAWFYGSYILWKAAQSRPYESLEEARSRRLHRRLVQVFDPYYPFEEADLPIPRPRGARLRRVLIAIGCAVASILLSGLLLHPSAVPLGGALVVGLLAFLWAGPVEDTTKLEARRDWIRSDWACGGWRFQVQMIIGFDPDLYASEGDVRLLDLILRDREKARAERGEDTGREEATTPRFRKRR